MEPGALLFRVPPRKLEISRGEVTGKIRQHTLPAESEAKQAGDEDTCGAAADGQETNLHEWAWMAVAGASVGNNQEMVHFYSASAYRGKTLILGMGNPPIQAMGKFPIMRGVVISMLDG